MGFLHYGGEMSVWETGSVQARRFAEDTGPTHTAARVITHMKEPHTTSEHYTRTYTQPSY